MQLTEVYNDPAIIDIDIPEFEDFDFDSYFRLPSKRSDYGKLTVELGRISIDSPNPMHDKLIKLMTDPIFRITKKLMTMDHIRWPIFRYSSFEEFYKKDIAKRNRLGIIGTIDHQGWSQPWHLDNRFVMISGSINIQDNITSTHFAKENFHWLNGGENFDHCDLIYKGRTTKFSGTAWINTEHTWHCVPRVVEEQRKTILFNVFL